MENIECPYLLSLRFSLQGFFRAGIDRQFATLCSLDCDWPRILGSIRATEVMSTITVEIDAKAAETTHCCFMLEICTSVVRSCHLITRSSDDRLSLSQPDSVISTLWPKVIARPVPELARIMCRKKVFPASINWELPS